jgi:3'-phosphoadenosine 5'-phosphosulfate sulfotransferase (PAPS reductase)/FAD synthetase
VNFKVLPHELKQKQSLPLEVKVRMTKLRIQEWYEHWDGRVYVSFSGGKDSTVLLHIVRGMYPDVKAVFFDTGLEYPEIREFVKTIDNVDWIKPEMSFLRVIEKHGYPVISKEVASKLFEIASTNSDKLKNKRLYGDLKGNGKLPEKYKYLIDAPFKIGARCCDVMKKRPAKKYEKETSLRPIIGTMAQESRMRQQKYLQNGCNGFNLNRPVCQPLSFWLEQDIWDYVKQFNVPYSKIYDMGYDRTGCMFCMFGVHMEKGENRFQRMKRTHPNQWNYCINKLGIGHCLDLINVEYNEYIEQETQAEICITQEEDKPCEN